MASFDQFKCAIETRYRENVVPDGCGWDHPIYLAAVGMFSPCAWRGRNSASKGYAFGSII